MTRRYRPCLVLFCGCVFVQASEAEERALKDTLFSLRTAIDKYTFDKHKGPQELTDLVRTGYLSEIPVDPITKSPTSWRFIMEDKVTAVNQPAPRIFDVRSGSDAKSREGTRYSEW